MSTGTCSVRDVARWSRVGAGTGTILCSQNGHGNGNIYPVDSSATHTLIHLRITCPIKRYIHTAASTTVDEDTNKNNWNTNPSRTTTRTFASPNSAIALLPVRDAPFPAAMRFEGAFSTGFHARATSPSSSRCTYAKCECANTFGCLSDLAFALRLGVQPTSTNSLAINANQSYSTNCALRAFTSHTLAMPR